VTVPDRSSCPLKRRRAVTVERLLDAALATFADLGFHAASVEDICRRGGFTRGAFYSSFSTKDELFMALFRRETAAKMARLETQLAGFEAADDPIATVVERCLDTLGQDRQWQRVFLEYTLLATRTPAAAATLAEHTRDLFSHLATVIAAAAARAGIELAIPPGELARIAVALHDGITLQELPGGPAGDSSLQHPALLLLLRAVTGQPTPSGTNPPHTTEGTL
jgi:AcrR family transcriptional regulator